MMTKVAASGLSYHILFLSIQEKQCEWNKKTYLVDEV
jgi:hypothetical protein